MRAVRGHSSSTGWSRRTAWGDSLVELLRELRAIESDEPITRDEMQRVIAGSTRELPGQFETADALLSSLASSARYGRPLDYASTLTQRYEALELAGLQSAAKDVVTPDSLTPSHKR